MTHAQIAVISVIMTIFGYSFYFRDIFAGKTKPHAFSWLVWGTLTGIAFFGQLADGAGAGAWVTATTSLISLVIFFLALQRGEKEIKFSDKLNLLGAGVALVLWAVTSGPLLSIILITIIDFLGFLPTIRKSYYKPQEETLIHYVFAGLKFVLGIMALDNYTVVTYLYPLSLVLANWWFIIFLVVRRKQLGLKPGDRSTK
ncbi:hypothetical protein KC957_02680 [Candidatus Saccharibacteria bacterium]|nr:hypothetical protein [Candidatus Saccharibacteria bacterium]